MKVALLCTNLFTIDERNKTGSGIFNYILVRELAARKGSSLDVTVFASGESATLPLKVVDVGYAPSSADAELMRHDKHIIFELALLSKAFSKQEEFDVYHMSFGDGDLAMPFAPFVARPIVVTLHNIVDAEYVRRYFSLFANSDNVFFVSTSNYQRRLLPMLRYVDTIYHGIDTQQFAFDAQGGEGIMWAGRYIPEKGADTVLALARAVGRPAALFGVVKKGYEAWFAQAVQGPAEQLAPQVSVQVDTPRAELVPHFQRSKVFVLPTQLEEAFGLVYAEAMACGTPVVTYARGAAPEVVEDGVTGFLVNPSDDDVRGDFIIKQTGAEGLREAIEKIYSLSADEYAHMRRACRQRAEKLFSAQHMADKYAEVYTTLCQKN